MRTGNGIRSRNLLLLVTGLDCLLSGIYCSYRVGTAHAVTGLDCLLPGMHCLHRADTVHVIWYGYQNSVLPTFIYIYG
jgi:hypothetical protein